MRRLCQCLQLCGKQVRACARAWVWVGVGVRKRCAHQVIEWCVCVGRVSHAQRPPFTSGVMICCPGETIKPRYAYCGVSATTACRMRPPAGTSWASESRPCRAPEDCLGGQRHPRCRDGEIAALIHRVHQRFSSKLSMKSVKPPVSSPVRARNCRSASASPPARDDRRWGERVRQRARPRRRSRAAVWAR